MNKATKGAIAAAAAAVLLLGGAGSLAYWTASGTVAGGTITAGDLALSAPSCGSGWTYDAGEEVPGATFTPGTSLLVPGDVISETCTTTLTATGEHMRGTIAVSTPDAITPYVVSVGAVTGATPALGTGNEFTEANDGNTLSITITVTFPDNGDPGGDTTGDNQYQQASAALSSITLTATQVHS